MTDGARRQDRRQDRLRVPVLGFGVDALTPDQALRRVLDWGKGREPRFVTLCNVHVLVTARGDAAFGRAIDACDLALPDGMPVAWTLRAKGVAGQLRIGGPDFLLACCEAAAREGVPVYLYGSTQDTLDAMAARLLRDNPGLTIAGIHSPPFRPQTDDEVAADIAAINASGAGLVFIGLGCPKQELWIHKHGKEIRGVCLAVGAAFDFAAGLKARAPLWMQRSGLEWLHRLCQEPGRLWRRYLGTNSRFVLYSLLELCGLGGRRG